MVLNGTSSAGKTSLTKALQEKLAEPYLHFKMDVFWYMVPAKMDANSEQFPNMKYAIIDSAKALLDRGHNVIMDIVCTPENISVLKESFKHHNIHLIAVKADLDVLQERERKRGDRKIGLAESQYDKIHKGISYDCEVDTTHKTSDNCADYLLKKYLFTDYQPPKIKPPRI